jgi:hypothetical protein
MRSFSSGSFGRNNDPWFRVGDVGVTTTIALTAMGAFSIFLYVIEGNQRTLSKYFWLTPRGISTAAGPSVTEGGVWRIVTWPLFLEPGARIFFAAILIAIFYMLGSRVEEVMGRIRYARFLGFIIVLPAIAVVVLDLGLGIQGVAGGLRFPELAVLVAFALIYPEARFFFGLPAWGIAVGIVVIEALQTTADRNWFGLLLGTFVVGLATLLVRAMGLAQSATWIPHIPLPASLGGSAQRSPGRSRPSRARRKSNLRSVAPDPVQDDLADMEIDALLDQVANEGLDSLTKAQRKRLEEHSKRMRKRKD